MIIQYSDFNISGFLSITIHTTTVPGVAIGQVLRAKIIFFLKRQQHNLSVLSLVIWFSVHDNNSNNNKFNCY